MGGAIRVPEDGVGDTEWARPRHPMSGTVFPRQPEALARN